MPTVDGWNPAPPRMMILPLFIGFHTSQVVQDFFHQQQETVFCVKHGALKRGEGALITSCIWFCLSTLKVHVFKGHDKTVWISLHLPLPLVKKTLQKNTMFHFSHLFPPKATVFWRAVWPSERGPGSDLFVARCMTGRLWKSQMLQYAFTYNKCQAHRS